MATSAIKIAKKTEKLASFSDVGIRIAEALQDERSSAADISGFIKPDPALSSALLRIANSASYKTHATIDSVEAAIKTIGLRQVRDLAFAISAVKAFEGIPNELIDMEDFWKHSLYTAVAAQQLADKAKLCRGHSLFTAGLLHDMGQLAMFSQESELSREALRLSLEQEDDNAVCSSERLVFGFDHTEVGSLLATCWKFPDSLKTAIIYHHDPQSSPTADLADVAMIVNVANSLSVLAELECDEFDSAPSIDEAALIRCDVGGKEGLLEIVEATSESANELLQLFSG